MAVRKPTKNRATISWYIFLLKAKSAPEIAKTLVPIRSMIYQIVIGVRNQASNLTKDSVQLILPNIAQKYAVEKKRSFIPSATRTSVGQKTGFMAPVQEFVIHFEEMV